MSFHIIVHTEELFDEERCEFILGEPIDIEMEHSLYTISKWEEKWHKAYLESSEQKQLTDEEALDYMKCMIINDVDPDVLRYLTKEDVEEIQKNLNNKATATTFSDKDHHLGATHQTTTSELLYGQMAVLGIPFEPCEHWHLNRLIALIHVTNTLNSPPKKMSKKESAQYQSNLIAKRRAEAKAKALKEAQQP